MVFFLKLLACIAACITYGAGLWLQPFSPVTFILGIPVCLWLVSFLHELGHLLAFLLLKLEWKRMVISFFVFERRKGVRVDRRQRLFAASCTCAHRTTVPLWRYRIALLSGGGLTLALSAAFWVIFAFSGGWLAAFSLCFGSLCLLNAVVNLLLPFSADRILLKRIKIERENSQ